MRTMEKGDPVKGLTIKTALLLGFGVTFGICCCSSVELLGRCMDLLFSAWRFELGADT